MYCPVIAPGYTDTIKTTLRVFLYIYFGENCTYYAKTSVGSGSAGIYNVI
jgi:hypothetical protein